MVEINGGQESTTPPTTRMMYDVVCNVQEKIRVMQDKINEQKMTAQSLVDELTPMTAEGAMITESELNTIKTKYKLV